MIHTKKIFKKKGNLSILSSPFMASEDAVMVRTIPLPAGKIAAPEITTTCRRVCLQMVWCLLEIINQSRCSREAS